MTKPIVILRPSTAEQVKWLRSLPLNGTKLGFAGQNVHFKWSSKEQLNKGEFKGATQLKLCDISGLRLYRSRTNIWGSFGAQAFGRVVNPQGRDVIWTQGGCLGSGRGGGGFSVLM